MTTTSTLSAESYLFDPRPNYPLVATLNRFLPPCSDADGVTLIFTHGTGFNKEQWDPTIEDLVEIMESQSTFKDPNSAIDKTVLVREIWTIDFPNHGDAAVLNEETLQWGFEPFSWEEYARVLHAFVTNNGKLKPFRPLFQAHAQAGAPEVSVDVPYSFASHRIVLVGHSVGAIAAVMSLDQFPSIQGMGSSSCAELGSSASNSLSSDTLLRSLVLFEPMATGPPFTDPLSFTSPSSPVPHPSIANIGPGPFLAIGSAVRRDTWASREDAYKVMKQRQTWKVWDDRVLRKFVDHGLRPLPTLNYPDPGVQGMTLKCTRKQETATYRDRRGNATSYRNFASYAKRARLHIVYGAEHDIIVGEAKYDLINNAIGGPQNLASLEWVPGAAHSLPQTHPRACAERIFAALALDAEHECLRNQRGHNGQEVTQIRAML